MQALLVAGARPNFMKIAPLFKEAANNSRIDCKIVHTGQHYDYEMSQAFFEDLKLPEPHFFLNAGSGTHAQQTARIMVGFEALCEKERPDVVIVVGDVNSTLAASIVAKKQNIKVAHVEAGLRSFDLTMPEEINRMVTDAISDFFFVTEESALRNLTLEGKARERIYFVGNVMIDNLYHQMEELEACAGTRFSTFGLKAESKGYAFLTLHRPSNVDSREVFAGIAEAINKISEQLDVFFSVHPRTKKMIEQNAVRFADRVRLLPPLSYKEALYLWKDARMVLTDSGGLQEETTAIGVPCITIRNNTERPITVEMGSNRLAGNQKEGIWRAFDETLDRGNPGYKVPPQWDGKASGRIWKVLCELLHNEETHRQASGDAA
ncbi:MAG: UDP-N-acetylglucosamine 2-epimerase (non-hydrolyzing) [Desulfatitalea sp.]